MKITPSAPPSVGAATGSTANVAKPHAATRPSAPAELQSTAVRRALEESAEVDLQTVERVRRAIAEGRLTLDVEALADAVVSLHRK